MEILSGIKIFKSGKVEIENPSFLKKAVLRDLTKKDNRVFVHRGENTPEAEKHIKQMVLLAKYEKIEGYFDEGGLFDKTLTQTNIAGYAIEDLILWRTVEGNLLSFSGEDLLIDTPLMVFILRSLDQESKLWEEMNASFLTWIAQSVPKNAVYMNLSTGPITGMVDVHKCHRGVGLDRTVFGNKFLQTLFWPKPFSDCVTNPLIQGKPLFEHTKGMEPQVAFEFWRGYLSLKNGHIPQTY